MFLTRLPASALSDDISNRGTFHKTNDCLLFGSLASMISSSSSAVNARVLTESAHDNYRALGARSIIAQWCVTVCCSDYTHTTMTIYIYIYTTMHICFMLTTLAYGTEGLHLSAFIIIST